MKFCTECGHKLPTEQASFCPSCGHKLQSSSSVTSQPEPVRTEAPTVSSIPAMQQEVPEKPKVAAEAATPAKKKIKPVWYVVGVILLLVIGAMIYGVYEKSLYPKTETELNQVLLDKYWKTEEVNVKEIYVDGRLIQKPTSNVVKNVVNAVEGNTDAESFKSFEKAVNETYAKENFMVLKKQSDGKLFQFEMTYGKSQSEFVYNVTNPTISHNNKEDEYVLNYSEQEIPSYSMQTGWLIDDEVSVQLKDNTSTIHKITDRVLEYTSDLKFVIDGQEYRIIVYHACVPYSPSNDFKKRVEEQFVLEN